MTQNQKSLHEKFLKFKTRHRGMELEFIKILQEVERCKLHRAFGCPSVFKYVVDVIGFSESVAYTFISVARKAREIPCLLRAGLSVSKASRIVSTMTAENSEELIYFALHHTTAEIDREVARRNPKVGRERVKATAADFFEAKFAASEQFLEKLKRVEALQAQRGLQAGPGAAIEAALDEYIRRHDPVQKAQRAAARQASGSGDQKPTVKVTPDMPGGSGELCLNRVPQPRTPLTAAQKHAVHLRDGGRCAHVDANGRRCGSDRWVEIHHILEVSKGGSNEPANLTTLCSFHHDLVHQLSLPIDGQVNWLKSPVLFYG